MLIKVVDIGEGNFLVLVIEVGWVKVIVGEISFVFEMVYGCYIAEIWLISGVYSSEVGEEIEVVSFV